MFQKFGTLPKMRKNLPAPAGDGSGKHRFPGFEGNRRHYIRHTDMLNQDYENRHWNYNFRFTEVSRL